MSLRKLLFGRSVKESRELAEREELARVERDISRSCQHDCASCDYYAEVYEHTSSASLRSTAAYFKAYHADNCRNGKPDSSSCMGFSARA